MKKIDALLSTWIRVFHVFRDCIFSGIVLVLSVVFLILSNQIPISKLSTNALDSSRFMPQFILALLILFSVISMIKGIKDLPERKRDTMEEAAVAASVSQTKRACFSLGCIAIAIFLMPRLGFIPTAILYLIVNMMFMTQKEERNMKLYVLISVIAAVALYFVFAKFIYVFLPVGILKGVL